jgi:glyoxylase-like metal-dependent hydrolase (beta-lactamase superfamily II)
MKSFISSGRVSRRDALRLLGLAGGAALAAPGLLRAAGEAAAVPMGKPMAPSLAGEQAGYYRFRVGEIEALALFDGGFSAPADASPFAAGEPSGSVAAGLAEAWLPVEQVQVHFNVLLVRTGGELLMIDAGAGSAFGPAGGKVPAALAAAGVKPEQITGIVLSHAHGDHFGGLLDERGAARYRNAKIFVSRKEHAFWSGSAPDVSGMAVPEEARQGSVAGAQAMFSALGARLELVAGGDRILDGIELLDTPGHTPGHLAVLISSGKQELLHFVDAAHHHALSFAHPEWRFAYDCDGALAAGTRKKLFDRAAADKLLLFGAHMPFPALGRVRKAGNAYDYRIEPFVLG